MSSLKRKIEAALLKVITDSALFTGQLLHADEERNATIEPPCAVACYIPQGRTPSGAQERGLLLLLLKSPSDTGEADGDVPAEELHALYTNQLRDSVHVADWKTVLTLASTYLLAPIAVLQALPTAPPEPDPEDGLFQYVFAWETAAVDSDCS